MIKIPEHVLEFAPWSFSMANVANTCSLAFHRQYICRDKPEVAQSPQTEVGTVVHFVLELVLQGASVDVGFRRALGDYQNLSYNAHMQVLTFRDAIVDFAQRLELFKKAHRVQKTLVEKAVAITDQFTLCNWKDPNALLRGKIDLALLTEDKTRRLVVIDHKSGALKSIEKYSTQLKVYMVLADIALTGANVTDVRAAIHYVGADPQLDGTRSVWTPEYSIEEVRMQFREEIIEFLTHGAEAVNDPRPHKGWLCNFCGYKPSCPAHQ